jgi:hypothetical protein
MHRQQGLLAMLTLCLCGSCLSASEVYDLYSGRLVTAQQDVFQLDITVAHTLQQDSNSTNV